MPDFVEYTLSDGTQVLFESAETDLVALHRGGSTRDGGALASQLTAAAKAAGEVAAQMRANMEPDELSVELGIKIAGELNAWFFAKNKAEATITVTAIWKNGG